MSKNKIKSNYKDLKRFNFFHKNNASTAQLLQI